MFNLQFFPSYSVELKLDSVQKKIDAIKSMKEVVLGPSESQMFQVLQDITDKLNKTKISKPIILDTLTVLDTTDFIEEKFPQSTKLNFPENFLDKTLQEIIKKEKITANMLIRQELDRRKNYLEHFIDPKLIRSDGVNFHEAIIS